MELRYDPQLEDFRKEVRGFIDEVLPPEIKQRQRTKIQNNATIEDQQEWMRILNAHGRAVPHWPVEFGGCGWTPQQLFIFNEELYAADAPEFDWGGTHMLCTVSTLSWKAGQMGCESVSPASARSSCMRQSEMERKRSEGSVMAGSSLRSSQ